MPGKIEPTLFQAGTGKVVITPPIGFVIHGPEHPERLSTGIADDLLVRVIVLESQGSRVLLISLDVWGLAESLAEAIKDAVSISAAIDKKLIWLTNTGNGTSPPLWRDEPQYANYIAYLPELVSGAVLAALDSMEPASMGSSGTLLPDVSTFIDGPGLPGNPALFVVAINRADRTGIARIINFACPATIIGPSTLWTADYPGYACWALEQNGGGLSLFSQAPSHDIRPYDWWADNTDPTHADRNSQDVRAFGLLLATQANNAAAETVQRRNVEIAVRSDETIGVQVLRVGDAFFISTNKPQPNKFARRLRRHFPHSKTIVAANLYGGSFDAKATFDPRGIKRSVTLLEELGAT
tara:strand:- start:468 stop:1526 length:1059 start_codon:yes stop_codon:yes gene_type:complete